jgi:hypothetical protein
LSEKIISLEHRLNALSIQLDSQEIDDMELLTTKALRLDFMDDQLLIDYIESQIEDGELDESAYKDEPDKGAIGPVRGDTDPIESVTGEAVTIGDKPWYTVKELLDCHYQNWPGTRQGLQEKADREQWPKRTRRGSKGNPYEYQAVLPD